MYNERVLPCKLLATELALESFQIRVQGDLVILQVAPLAEGTPADVAWIGLQTLVNTTVNLAWK